MRAKFWIPVCLLLLILAFSGCNGDSVANDDPLDGTSWTLIAYRKTRSLPGATITAAFEEGQVHGSAGCNTYSGAYRVNGGTLTIEAVAITEKACLEPEGIMEQETLYVGYLTAAKTFRFVDGQLQIFWSDQEALTFAPQD
ncbi:MAG: META domain-containing protein [Anaerolineae bacterium]|nr:META domain-containing protein [Anaerolineae bacterium]